MAKKAKTEGVLARETRLRAEAGQTAADPAAADARAAAAATRGDAPPAATTPRPKKVKKARFVRAPQEKRPPTKAAAPAARSTKAAGKMMSKNVTGRPKAETDAWPKAETSPRPKDTEDKPRPRA